MKKVLVIISLVALMAVPLLGLTACGGTKLTDSDLATIRGFATRIDALEAAVASQQNKYNSLNTDSLKADLEQVKVDVASVKTDIGELKNDNSTDLNDLVTRIAALETRIAALEAKMGSGSGTTTSEAITAKIKTQFWDYIVLPAPGTTAASTQLRLDLQNNTARDISDVVVVVAFAPQSYVTVDWDTGYPQITGGLTTWTLYPYGGYGIAFFNSWGLNLAANEKKTITLTLTMKLKTAVTQNIQWVPEDVSVEDFTYK
jgi:hypothetical protein